MQVNPFLSFDGQCEEAFKFYHQTFGGQLEAMIPHKGSPMEQEVPPEWADKIMHAHLTFGDWGVMGSDCPPGTYDVPKGFSVSLQMTDVNEAERIFTSLSAEGTIQMPLAETFWAKRFGMVTDQYGIPWMINCE
ncbi:MAG: VOC family protein [Synechococcaceae cyanobacterium SM2_3_2]|nr:VOC family protein [Synechococcaceae cyanobacterium SM2_3_2]